MYNNIWSQSWWQKPNGGFHHEWWAQWMGPTLHVPNWSIYLRPGEVRKSWTLLMDSWAYSWAKTIKINQLSGGRTSADRNGRNPSEALGATLDETNEWSFTTCQKQTKNDGFLMDYSIYYSLISVVTCCNPIFVTMLKICHLLFGWRWISLGSWFCLSPSAVRCICSKIWSGGDKTGRWTCRDSTVDALVTCRILGSQGSQVMGNPKVTIVLGKWWKFHSPELLAHLGMIPLINHDSRARRTVRSL